eukprot:3554675-Alexandrium_andersonii.AAC.1
MELSRWQLRKWYQRAARDRVLRERELLKLQNYLLGRNSGWTMASCLMFAILLNMPQQVARRFTHSV